MRRPSVLQVNKYYPPHVGGVERVVRDIAEGLRQDFDLRVLACNDLGPFVRETWNGVRVTRTAMAGSAFALPLSVSFYSWYRRLSREADLVHFHLPFPLGDVSALLAGLGDRPAVAWYHSDIVRQRWAMGVYGPILRAFLRRVDRIFVATLRLKENSPYLSEVAEKCVLLPYGVRLQDLTGDVEPFPLPAKDFVLFVGRLVPYKGAEYLIDAMKAVDAPLLIVGEGRLRKDLEARARAAGLEGRVHFVDPLTGPRLRHCFRECRLFVLPSVMNSEAFGLVQLEAMACGKPVVNTDLPTGVPEVSLHRVSGLTVPPRNSVALAEAIRTILDDPEIYRSFSRGALSRAREFSMERFLDGVRRVYSELLG